MCTSFSLEKVDCKNILRWFATLLENGMNISCSTLLAQKRSWNSSWERSYTFLWKISSTFSERLCASFPHKHQGIFTDHLTSDYPNFTHHPQYLLTIFNFMCFKLLHVLCGKMFYMLNTDTLWKTFPERSYKVRNALTLWEPSKTFCKHYVLAVVIYFCCMFFRLKELAYAHLNFSA